MPGPVLMKQPFVSVNLPASVSVAFAFSTLNAFARYRGAQKDRSRVTVASPPVQSRIPSPMTKGMDASSAFTNADGSDAV